MEVQPEPSPKVIKPEPVNKMEDEKNNNINLDEEAEYKFTPVSPALSELGRAMNKLVINEKKVKVILSQDNKKCAICRKVLSRTDISLMECGHCFHFMCAIDWDRVPTLIDGKNVLTHECFICKAKQKELPLTLQQSIKIIGKEKMNEVFGIETYSPILTLVKN